MTHIDTHIPLSKQNSNYKKTPRLPWVTKSLLRSINRKNNLYYKFISQIRHDPNINDPRTEIYRSKYKKYKNTLTTTIRAAKKNYYSHQIGLHQHDVKNTWKVINNAVNKGGKILKHQKYNA